jgi:hypothetical protein
MRLHMAHPGGASWEVERSPCTLAQEEVYRTQICDSRQKIIS